MFMQAAGGALDFQVPRRAIEGRDAELLTVNRNSTPGSPQVLSGRDEIGEYLHDVSRREMTHKVENEVVGRIG